MLMVTLSFCFICTDENWSHTACCNSALPQASTVLLPASRVSLLGNTPLWLQAMYSLMPPLLAWISENHMLQGLLVCSARLKSPVQASKTTKWSKLYGRHWDISGHLDKSGGFFVSGDGEKGKKNSLF